MKAARRKKSTDPHILKSFDLLLIEARVETICDEVKVVLDSNLSRPWTDTVEGIAIEIAG